jgi:F0F1-type ATP synthase gamma subunit
MTGSYNTKVSKLLKTERKYYTKPHELDAQIFGFKRISKLTKTPFDVVVKRWFNTHHNLHQMDDKDVKYVIKKIMDFKKEKGL